MRRELDQSLDATTPATQQPRGLYVKTFGCQMNEYDTEKVCSLLAGDYRVVDDPSRAEVAFVNTCSVREKGEHKLFSLLGKLRMLKEEHPQLIVGVGGCVAQQEGERILQANDAVDFVVGTHNLSLIPSLVASARRGLRRQVAVDYRDEWEELPDAFLPLDEDPQSNPFDPVRALVAIQRGCNKHCAFCVVPRTRGAEVSRSPDEIEREVRLKVRLGAKEVLLLGQTVNSYGRDLSPRYPFETLIRRLAAIDGLHRIRFTSPHPADVRPGFIELYQDIPQLCRHIHLPLQSGSDRILKEMNRNYRTRRYLEIVDSLRQACPELAISTDLIVGFPTESDAEFIQTLEMMEKVQFFSSFSFKYSIRPNTVAKDRYRDEELIPEDVASARLEQLQTVQKQLSLKHHQRLMGTDVEVLVEGRR
ncbi:MAG: tRNA (N6-isopentenyl adenosine(37)-C2)-methylthiotransferase MiaB, partial [Bdellovibrionales bacterium]|nr:tRNA (N6-isopentenyl adenosine(37)-C2)-methylthiotransferase MiaB [Bdellovibrionales bacterium]